MPNAIETKGMEVLKTWLKGQGRIFRDSDNKTFDLIVDNQYAELKTKSSPYSKLDFLSFTDKQYNQIQNGSFKIFVVCNLKAPRNAEIFELKSEDFKGIDPKVYASYEYSRVMLDRIKK